VCVREAKNLATATEIKTVAGDIVDFARKQKKRGLAESTIKNRVQALSALVHKGARLQEPDSVETVLATEAFPAATKINLVRNYHAYCQMYGIPWKPIKVRYESPEPFIPMEQEIDQLIAGCGKSTATFLQVLKDTGARSGEASKINGKISTR